MLRDARKLARLLKTLNEYKKFIEILGGSSPAHIKALEAVGRVGFGTYWLFDNISWLSKNKVLKFDEKEASWWGAFGWTIGTLASVLVAVVKVVESYQKESALSQVPDYSFHQSVCCMPL
jgi:hypothetical protein